MLPSLSLLIFSPTGATKRVVTHIGNSLAQKVSQVDLLKKRSEKHVFSSSDFVLVGVPVYGGRVPEEALKALERFSGNGTPAVSVVVYGNRAYEDALLELNDTLESRGFSVMAAGAFVGRHSLVESIGKGRPDDLDRAEIEDFAQKIGRKYKKKKSEWSTIQVPGNRPYKEYKRSGVVPVSNSQCTKCGTCIAECPVGAITLDGTDPAKCFLCMRCAAVCPRKARMLPEDYREKVAAFLEQVCPVRSPNQVFL